MSAETQQNIHHLSYRSSLVVCAIDIEHQDRAGEGTCIDLVLSDEVLVDEHACGTRINEGAYTASFCSVSGLHLNLEVQGVLPWVECCDDGALGDPTLPVRAVFPNSRGFRLYLYVFQFTWTFVLNVVYWIY